MKESAGHEEDPRGGSAEAAHRAGRASDVEAIVSGCARRSLRGSRPAGVRRAAGRRAASSRMPSPSTAFTLAGKPPGELERRHDAGFFEGAALGPQAPAATLPRPQRRRRMVRDRPLFVRSGARADGRLLHRAKARISACSTSSAPTPSRTRAPTACISPSGRRTPGASLSSAPSTTGTAAAIRCGSRRTPASGRSSFPISARVSPTNSRSSGRTAARLPLKADPFAFRSELRPPTASVTASPARHEWGDEAHRDFWAKADHRREPISIYEVHAGSWQLRRGGRRGVRRRSGGAVLVSTARASRW